MTNPYNGDYGDEGRESEPPPWNEKKNKYDGGTRMWFRVNPSDHDAKEHVAGSVTGIAQYLLNLDRIRTDRMERYFRLYGGTRLIGIRPWESPEISTTNVTANRAIQDALRLNVCKAATDTITSKVGKLRPRPTFVTDHGDWSTQLRAKNLQRFMDGAYHQSDAYELGADVFRDAMIFGTGVLHPYGEVCDGRGYVRAERTPPWEMFVDPADGLYGTPRCLYRIKWVSTDSAAAFWPGIKDWGAMQGDPESTTAVAYRNGYVRVVEAWCRELPGVECGAHAIVVGGECIKYEEWDHPGFPFVFVHWSKPIQGFWGDSAIQEVVGLQVEINKLIQLVQRSMQLVGQPWVLKKHGAILKPDKLDNLPGAVLDVDANVSLSEAIQVITFQPVHPQVVAHIWSLYSKAFEILGSNQLAASATAPPGLESGRALEALADEHSERFMTVSRHFEHALGKQLAEQFIRIAKELDEQVKGGFVLRAPGKGKQTLSIKWRDVAIENDAYLVQVWPESVLPATPSARMSHVKELQEMGIVSGETARRVLRFPDLEAEDDLATADEDNLRRQLADMLEDGIPVVPEPYQRLDQAIMVAQQAVLRAGADRVPNENIDLVRDFIAACEELMRRAAPPPAPAPAPGAPPAPGPADVMANPSAITLHS